MRKFPRTCDPLDCKRCEVSEGSAECLIRQADLCTKLIATPIARLYRDEMEKLSLEMMEEAGAVSEYERLLKQDGVVVPFGRKRGI